MAKSLSITVHPSALGAEFLTVSDAMRQVLDFIEVLEKMDSARGDGQRIVWRLTDAHTNSPPFTVTAEAFAGDPTVSVAYEAQQVIGLFASGMRHLLDGETPDWLEADVSAPLQKIFKRNLNGIGQTEVAIEDEEPFDILPGKAKTALIAIDRAMLDIEAEVIDHRHTEYGSVEGEVVGLTSYYDARALVLRERLSGERITCVLSADLAAKIGPEHRWLEAWGGRRYLIGGSLQYGPEGMLKRIDAVTFDEVPAADVALTDIRGADILGGDTVKEHLKRFWGDGLV